MKVIIAGGRYYVFGPKEAAFLDRMRWEIPITEVVSGMAPGADSEGWQWAHDLEIPIQTFPAAWNRWGIPGAVVGVRANGSKYNKLAGFWRNQEMADYADALIAFPGGTGTADMVERARAKGLKVIHFIPGITQ